MNEHLKLPVGYQQLTVSNSAVGLTVPPGSVRCVIVIENNAVRWRDDGTDPTASIGVPMNPTDNMNYDGALAKLKLIRSGSADAVANIAYYGPG